MDSIILGKSVCEGETDGVRGTDLDEVDTCNEASIGKSTTLELGLFDETACGCDHVRQDVGLGGEVLVNADFEVVSGFGSCWTFYVTKVEFGDDVGADTYPITTFDDELITFYSCRAKV